jgi:peptidylprolyl isomerase
MDKVCSDAAVDEYFKLNSPKFDCIEVSHIVVDNEGMAKEMVSALSEDPESFPAMAREYSIAETRETGGQIGKVLRGSLKTDIEAKVFNSAVGELLGPFQSADGSFFELFIVNAKHPAKLDDETKTEVRRRLREEWLMARSQEHLIQAR